MSLSLSLVYLKIICARQFLSVCGICVCVWPDAQWTNGLLAPKTIMYFWMKRIFSPSLMPCHYEKEKFHFEMILFGRVGECAILNILTVLLIFMSIDVHTHRHTHTYNARNGRNSARCIRTRWKLFLKALWITHARFVARNYRWCARRINFDGRRSTLQQQQQQQRVYQIVFFFLYITDSIVFSRWKYEYFVILQFLLQDKKRKILISLLFARRKLLFYVFFLITTEIGRKNNSWKVKLTGISKS